MRQSAFFLSIAALVLCVLWSNGRCAERPGTPSANATQRAAGATASAQETSVLNGGAVDAALTRLSGTSFQATPTEHFVVYHEPGARYVTGICETLEYAHAYFYEVFTQAGFELSASKDRLVWICFPQKSGFNRYALQVEGMDLSWLDGYYSTLTNRVAIVQTDRRAPRREESVPLPGSDLRVAVAADRSPREAILAMLAAGRPFDITRLTHEVAHQLAFNSGVQKRGVMYPLWVSEGLATNFEFDGGEDAGTEHCNNARCKGLLEAYHGGQLIPLRQFVVQTTVPPDMQVSRRHYAQAWGFFHFILTERPEHLRVYLRRLADLRPYRRDANTMLAEFTEAFGSPEALEKSWDAFLERHARHDSAGRLAASGAVGGQTPPEP